MTHVDIPTSPRRPGTGRGGDGEPPPRIPRFSYQRPGPIRSLIAIILALAIVYTGYFWFVRRVVVGPNEVLVLMKKDGTRSLPADQIIIPRAPDGNKDPQAYATWKQNY